MAVIISTSVYNFDGTGNEKISIQERGLPVAGAFVEPASSPDPRVYIYSRIRYPGLALADSSPLYTAETVAEIIAKMQA
jgi:hypothetical protein